MSSDFLALSQFRSLKPSERLPTVFLGHGSPMNLITDNPWRSAWQALGRQFDDRWPRPQLILCISAHWLTEGWWLTAMDRPRTIHDFGGFPQALFDQRYPAPGSPAAASEMARGVRQRHGLPLGLDLRWGLDHGAWCVLAPMFPAADIPVVQLSMDFARPPEEHFALAQQLRGLRERGVLIVASGNIVHNLGQMQPDARPDQAHDWAIEFDETIAGWIEQGRRDRLSGFMALGSLARMAQPTHEHYLPLLYAAAAADSDEQSRFFNLGFQAASISMRSVVWGDD